MSEQRRRVYDSLEQLERRLGELQEPLRAVAGQAVGVYEALRPKAIHIGGSPRNARLLHQQVHGWSMATQAPGGIVADYLMIHIGEDHDLVLYQDFTGGSGRDWRFTCTSPLEYWHYQETKITVGDTIRFSHDHNISVAKMKHGAEKGMNTGYIENLSPDYEEAERYIAEFAADLDLALALYGA